MSWNWPSILSKYPLNVFMASESSAQHISWFKSQICGHGVLSFWSHGSPPLVPPLSRAQEGSLCLLSLSLSAYLQAVQATMILATILCCVGFFVFILQLFRLKQGERFVFTAIIQLLFSTPEMVQRVLYSRPQDRCFNPVQFAFLPYQHTFNSSLPHRIQVY